MKIGEMKDFFSSFRRCESKGREFFYNFPNLNLKEVNDKKEITTEFYFYSRGFIQTAGGTHSYEKYYEADDKSLVEWNKAKNCVGPKKSTVGRSDVDGVDLIELLKKE